MNDDTKESAVAAGRGGETPDDHSGAAGRGGETPDDHGAAMPGGPGVTGGRGKSWPAPRLNITGRLGLVKFIPDEQSHLTIIDPDVCRNRCPERYCTHTCPAQVYRWEDEEEQISIAYEGCLECGTCRSGGCPWENIEMRYPRGGFGVQYRFG